MEYRGLMAFSVKWGQLNEIVFCSCADIHGESRRVSWRPVGLSQIPTVERRLADSSLTQLL